MKKNFKQNLCELREKLKNEGKTMETFSEVVTHLWVKSTLSGVRESEKFYKLYKTRIKYPGGERYGERFQLRTRDGVGPTSAETSNEKLSNAAENKKFMVLMSNFMSRVEDYMMSPLMVKPDLKKLDLKSSSKKPTLQTHAKNDIEDLLKKCK